MYPRKVGVKKRDKIFMKRKSLLYVIIDIIIVAISFLFIAWLKPATKKFILPTYLPYMVGFLFIWLIISILSDKYNPKSKEKVIDIIASISICDFTILAIISILIALLHITGYSRMIVFGTLILSYVLECFSGFIYFYHRKIRNNNVMVEPIDISDSRIQIPDIFPEEQPEELLHSKIENIEDSIYPHLKNRYLSKYPELLEFIENRLELEKIHKDRSLILYTHTLYNIENIEPASQKLFINLHKVNDIRRINKYFIKVNKNLKFGGYFIGCGETLKERKNKFFTRYSKLIAIFFYFADFIYKRIFPKLPITKEIVFAITKGENRAISKCEILGRLYFCGFELVDLKELYGKLYFIVKKKRKPIENAEPSYGPIFKMKRVGKDGKMIYTYKLRTMHPYAEYLQKHIHDKYNLANSGKFKYDFRITGWGKWFRRLFIDELPMLINWFHGELNLVGVRPLSQDFFNRYPDDLKKERVKYKPGLIPPYYADLPNSIEEVWESERKYLAKYKQHALLTQIRYFWKALVNIIFKNARSG
ncbi:MAG: hypothetical protein DRH57_03295 [Candidatus Cloacimonadota bacterium]|nr:MAG: hypothetical protein DRH57_03295 [Candidatus Cloacimonadota bacterium]